MIDEKTLRFIETFPNNLKDPRHTSTESIATTGGIVITPIAHWQPYQSGYRIEWNENEIELYGPSKIYLTTEMDAMSLSILADHNEETGCYVSAVHHCLFQPNRASNYKSEYCMGAGGGWKMVDPEHNGRFSNIPEKRGKDDELVQLLTISLAERVSTAVFATRKDEWRNNLFKTREVRQALAKIVPPTLVEPTLEIIQANPRY